MTTPPPSLSPPGATPPAEPGPRWSWPTALRLGLVLWAGELVLTRVSSGEPVATANIAFSAVAMVALSLGPALVLDLVPLPPRLRLLLHRLAGLALCGLIGLGILGPVVAQDHGTALALLTPLGLIALTAGLSHLLGDPAPHPRPAPVLVMLGAATLLAWLLGPGTLPAPASLAALFVGWLGLGMLLRGNRRLALAALLALAIARAPLPNLEVPWSERAEGSGGPDLVLITVDTLRADAATAMSSYKALATDGVAFTAAQAPAPWTLPSIASTLTGVPPSIHGAGAKPDGVRSGIGPDTPALAAELQARGYDTAAVLAPNPFVGASFGLDRGFDYFYQPGWSPHALPRGTQNLAASPLLARVAQKLLKVVLDRSVDGEALTDHALAVLAQRRDRPLLLWIHYLDPHLPYVHTIDPSVSPATRAVINGDFHAALRQLDGGRHLEAELRAAYMDEVAMVDGQVARLLEALGPEPPRGRIVVLTSDHGEEFFEHDAFEHGHSLYQELIGVPLVISGLAREPGVETRPVALMDLAPTLLAPSGGAPTAMMGIDLAGAVDPQRLLRSGNLLRGHPRRLRASRRGHWKLIVEDTGATELFDLDLDPGETRNLSDSEPEVMTWLQGGPPPPALGTGATATPTGEQNARLEALGYIDDED